MSSDKTLAVVLGGGRGTRLWPLTKLRAKPAVPIGGKYRLIDIPLSNCLNSGLQQIAILTQFNTASLHRHIYRTYHFDFFHPGWVQILAAEQTFLSTDWYQGTADAVRKQMFEIQATGAKEALILAGDHLYRMDYRDLIDYHRSVEADVTVAVIPVSAAEASRFGVLKQEESGRIVDFVEKPKSESALTAYASRADAEKPYLGSMGIYVFEMEVLSALLDHIEYDDFGADVLPGAIHSHRVYGYPFEGYWEDIGTMRAFYQANLKLAHPEPDFNFHDLLRPIYTRPRFLPGSRTYDVELDRALLSDGCIIEGAAIRNAVVGIRSVIGEQVRIEDTVMMGADYYENQAPEEDPAYPLLGIGRGSRIRGAIIDKNARIGEGVRIDPFPPEAERVEEDWEVHDGIVVIPKNAVLADDTVIGP